MSDAGNQAAFPSDKHFGLTKREYFAGLAMQGILASPDDHRVRYPSVEAAIDEGVRMSVRWADRLLAALEGKDDSGS